jgi:hypothetical protein
LEERFKKIKPTTIRKMSASPPSTPPTIAPMLFDEGEDEELELELLGVDAAVLVLVACDEDIVEDDAVAELAEEEEEEVKDPAPTDDGLVDEAAAAPLVNVVFGVAR